MAIEVAALRGIPEFSALSDAELTHVHQVTRERHMQRGELLFLEGEPGERLHYLRSGQVKGFKISADGKEQVLRIFHVGETFNEVPVFDGGPNPARAMVLEEGTAYVLHRGDIRRLLSEHTATDRETHLCAVRCGIADLAAGGVLIGIKHRQ